MDVVATVAPLADIVQNAGGARVRVTALVPAGADPHVWRPGPTEREAMAEADLVVWTGGRLDGWAADAGGERQLGLLPRVDPLGGDPHWWQDPVRVQRAAKEIRNELARADVDGAGYYEAATADYLERLRKLHSDIAICVSLLDQPQTRLVTQHDGFAYFNERYGTAIAGPRGTRAKVGRALWADSLGPPEAATGSYLGAMAANTATLVDAIGGRGATCEPDP